MTPEQTRLLAETFAKLENRLPELAAAIYEKLFEISPESRPLFKGSMDQQNAKLARSLRNSSSLKRDPSIFFLLPSKAGRLSSQAPVRSEAVISRAMAWKLDITAI
jgi:hypothetical protein